MASIASEEVIDPADELMFLCLGGGNEVGRSSHIIQYKGKTVMVSEPEPGISEHHSNKFSGSSMLVNILLTMGSRGCLSMTTSI